LYDSGASTSSDEEEHIDKSALFAKIKAQLSGLFDLSSFAPPPPPLSESQSQSPDNSSANYVSEQNDSDDDSDDDSDEVNDKDEDDKKDRKRDGEERKEAAAAAAAAAEEEEAFTFRLFRDEAPTHTVVLTRDDDSKEPGEGGFVVPSRPRSYYIADPPTAEQESAYRSVAVTAEYLFADAKKRKWGLEKPWRVIHITSCRRSGSKIEGVVATATAEVAGEAKGPAATATGEGVGPKVAEEQVDGDVGNGKKKRKRPGKKHRIVARMKAKQAREREETAKKQALEKELHLQEKKKQALEKELHLQEKKKRLNREKKLKRRQKEREKKAQAKGQAGGAGAGEGGGGGDGGSDNGLPGDE
jgi:hypothetical protein